MRTHRVLLAAVAVLAATTSCSSSDDAAKDDAAKDDAAKDDAGSKMQVVLDYSPTLSDAGALV